MPTDLLGNVGSAVGTGASALGNMLDAQRWGVAKGLTGQSDTGDQREAYRKAIGFDPLYKRLPHAVQGAADVGLDTITDPLTYETLGAKPLLGGLKAGLGAMSSLGKAGLSRMPDVVQKGAQGAGDIGQGISEAWTRMKAPGGSGVGQLEIEQGRPARDLLLGATSKGKAEEDELGKRLEVPHAAAIKGLKPGEEENIYKSLKGEMPPEWLTPEQQATGKALKLNSDTASYINANRGTRARISMGQGGLGERTTGKTLPSQPEPPYAWKTLQPATELTRSAKRKLVSQAPIKPMDVAPNLREFVGEPGKGSLAEFRAKYLTAPHTGTLADAAKEPHEYNPLTWENPNRLPQPPKVPLSQAELPAYRKAWTSMLENAAREKARTGIRGELEAGGLDLKDPTVVNALKQTTKGTGKGQQALDAYKHMLKYGKAGIVGFTPLHAVNILKLGVEHLSPAANLKALPVARQIIKHPEQEYDLLREGRALGADMNSREHGYFENWPLLLRMGLGGTTGAVAAYNKAGPEDASPLNKLERGAVGGLVGAGMGAAAPAWTREMTRRVFAYDKALKQAGAKEYAAKGIGGTHQYGAGRQATEDLIDYGNQSEIGKVMSWGSMFPTYRSQLPGSVLRGVAKNPAKVEAINRATQGLYGGSSTTTPAGTLKDYTSVPDVGRAIGDPKSYLRSSMAGPVRIGASMLQKFGALPQTKQPYYATYGQDPMSPRVWLSAALAGDPQAQTILNEIGAGMHPGTPLQDLLYQFTGLGLRK
jgi:hypothetical protein